MTAVPPPSSAIHPHRRRIRDGKTRTSPPAARRWLEGCVSICGKFARENRDEVVALVRSFEHQECAAQPDKRIVSIRDEGETLFIDTNDVRLARAIGEQLHNTYQGELRFHFGESSCLVRVHWQR